MAKGFTVKASKPKGVKKQDKPEWDYDAIKTKRIVVRRLYFVYQDVDVHIRL